jgi:ferredoxin
MTDLTDKIDHELSSFGLKIRGIKIFDEPVLIDGLNAKSVALIGHIGSEHWDCFEDWWSKEQNSQIEHPLDEWSKLIIKPLACKFQGAAVFPSDKPYYPFQNWALAAGNLSKSKINVLINKEYGTWHGYRGAIAFDFTAEITAFDEMALDLCASCFDKPCISACPVKAFSSEHFLYSECQDYLKSEQGAQSCMANGCASRNACPYGERYKYKSPHMRFHMRAFRNSDM